MQLKSLKEVQEAYEVLSDDQSVHNMIDLVMLVLIKASVALAAEETSAVASVLKISLSSFFGGGGGRRRDPTAPRQGADLQYQVTLDFEEAIFGKELNIEIPVEDSVILV